jgi:hypothetical protein
MENFLQSFSPNIATLYQVANSGHWCASVRHLIFSAITQPRGNYVTVAEITGPFEAQQYDLGTICAGEVRQVPLDLLTIQAPENFLREAANVMSSVILEVTVPVSVEYGCRGGQ